MPRTADDIIESNRKQQRRERNDPNNLHYNQKKVDNPVITHEVAEQLRPTPQPQGRWVPEYK